MSNDIVREVCSFVNPGWCALPSVGAASGIVLIWESKAVDVEVEWVDFFSISVVASLKSDSNKWLVTGVYGPTEGGQIFNEFINELEG